MLFTSRDPHTGITSYMVCNDAGLCLIYTTSSRIAEFVERHSRGVPPTLRLTVGGDPGTRTTTHLWQHVRRWSK